MGAILQDIRYGFRMLGKNAAFTTIAIVTLALGIGSNTAIFSVVNAVLLRPLPYPQGQRIVEICRTYQGQLDMSNFTARQFSFWKGHSDPFEYLAATTSVGFNLAGASRPERVRALRVSSEYFHVVGVQPALGRDFVIEEDQIGGPNIAILSDGIWRRDLGADRHVLGRTILLDGTPFTVVGVMPAGFESIPAVDLWTTIGQVAGNIGSGSNYTVIGRLKPSVSRPSADSYLSAFTRLYLQEFARGMPDDRAKDVKFAAIPYRSVMTGDLRTPLMVLFAAVGFVLLIACVNVANLQMARAATRTREIAVRAALGAGRRRIFLQLLVENVVLALMGAAVGLVVAPWALSFMLSLTPRGLVPTQEISLDRWALGFTALVAVLAGTLFGLAPAFQISRTDLNECLKESGGRATPGRQHGRLSALLAAAEVALSLVLLVGSMLLIETFANLLRIDPGFDPRSILTLQTWTTGSPYKSGAALGSFYERLVQKLEAVPGVESAAVVAAGLPLEQGGNVAVQIVGRKDSKRLSIDYREITPKYFATLGVPLLQGRTFGPMDSESAHKVVIVNAGFSRRYFPDRNPLGEYLLLEGTSYEIVGVVGDIRSYLSRPAPPTSFIPLAQAPYALDQLFQGWFPTCVLVKTAPRPMSLSHEVENAVHDVDPDLPIGRVRSMEEVLSISLAFQRFLMTLMSIFAGLALMLAAIGLYGVISYSVTQRTHEIGVRMALGARPRDVLRMIVSQGLRLALLGVGIGLAASFALTRLLRSMLFGVQPTDPLTFVGVAVMLSAVALAASYIPARRATKVDPIVALRYE